MQKPTPNQSDVKSKHTELIDNRILHMGEYLKERLALNSVFKFVSAYFTIYGFQEMREKLEKVEQVKFLYGDMTNIKGLDPEGKEAKNYILTEENELIKATDQLHLKSEALACKQWFEKESVEVKGIKESNLLHGKMYNIKTTDADGGIKQDGIIGSSNFTKRGLGFGQGSNYELNLAVTGDECNQLENWFDSLWGDDKLAQDIKPEVIAELEKLGKDQSPEFIYFKTLYEVFKDRVEEQKDSEAFDEEINFHSTEIYKKLYSFQSIAVSGILQRLRKHNGCILSDSVGLGKTFTALAVIKHYELRGKKVLVLCPNKLRNNWALYKASTENEDNPLEEDNLSYTLLNHTDLSSRVDDDDNLIGFSGDVNLSKLNLSKYDLVVIDESHNFRTKSTGRIPVKNDANRRKKTRYERLIDDVIKAAKNTQVLMLSATPINNSLQDLRNQIYLMSKGEDNHFADKIGINNLEAFFKQVEKEYANWSDLDPKFRERLDKVLGSDFFTLLDEISIARSREHIKKYYAMKGMEDFPTREKPERREPTTDRDNKITYEELYKDIEKFTLSIYHPAEYPKGENKSEGGDTSQKARERNLIGMMRVNMLKRLESSVYAFVETLKRTIKKSEDILENIEKFKNSGEKEQTTYNVNEQFVEYEGEEGNEEIEEMTAGSSQVKPIYLKDLNLDRWSADIINDKDALKDILVKVQGILDGKRDAKIDQLRDDISAKLDNPTYDKDGNKCKKLLIFTAFADTANYLYKELKDELQAKNINVACVTGTGSKSTLNIADFNKILSRFSPKSKGMLHKANNEKKGLSPDEEIDIVIATDCISEGQNLQDCDTVISYDIHWNPVRLIQRFGRVDRIGSRHKSVRMINYWPTKGLDLYIKINKRITDKMALVDAAATGDDNILQDDDKSHTHDLLRGLTINALQDIYDGSTDFDKIPEDEFRMQNFTLEDFRAQLMQYINHHEKELKEAVNGLYAVTNTQSVIEDDEDNKRNKAIPGIIFCLKQKNINADTKKQGAGLKSNPIYPHILVYMKADGTEFYGYSDAKDILITFGKIAAGKTVPNDELCNKFNTETNNGTDMASIEKALQIAQKNILAGLKKQNFGAFAFGAGRNAVMTKKQDLPQDDNYELITWLVIY